MVKNAKDGYFNGGRVPYGYEVYQAPENPKRKRLRPYQPEAEIVRRIFKMRIKGFGGRAIAMLLREEGVKNRDTEWYKYSVSSLLRNDAVRGCVVFGRRARGSSRVKLPREKWIIVQSHEPIIYDDDWDRVQSMMDDATNPQQDHLNQPTHSPASWFVKKPVVRCRSRQQKAGNIIITTAGMPRNTVSEGIAGYLQTPLING
jgi:hypothetical protein